MIWREWWCFYDAALTCHSSSSLLLCIRPLVSIVRIIRKPLLVHLADFVNAKQSPLRVSQFYGVSLKRQPMHTFCLIIVYIQFLHSFPFPPRPSSTSTLTDHSFPLPRLMLRIQAADDIHPSLTILVAAFPSHCLTTLTPLLNRTHGLHSPRLLRYTLLNQSLSKTVLYRRSPQSL